MTVIPSLIEGGVFCDDRGYISFVNDFDFKDVKRFYVLQDHEVGFVRAWHGHLKESEYVFVVSGSVMVGTVRIDSSEEPTKHFLTGRKPAILHIPPGFANGTMTLEPNTIVLFLSTSMLGASEGDEVRFDYDKWNIWEIEKR